MFLSDSITAEQYHSNRFILGCVVRFETPSGRERGRGRERERDFPNRTGEHLVVIGNIKRSICQLFIFFWNIYQGHCSSIHDDCWDVAQGIDEFPRTIRSGFQSSPAGPAKLWPFQWHGLRASERRGDGPRNQKIWICIKKLGVSLEKHNYHGQRDISHRFFQIST